MLKNNHSFLTTLMFCCTILLLGIASTGNAASIQNIHSLDELELKDKRDPVQITAPYSILSNATFTPNLDSYSYKDYNLKILDKEHSKKLILQIVKNLESKNLMVSSKIKEPLPWWSKTAPSVLKNLDFSKVDGKLNEYQIAKNYRLRLLSKQGHWGKVYVLERLGKDGFKEIICAVKLLLTRSEPDMSVQNFRERHQDEINNNLILVERNIDIADKPYGILENDADHYLLFLEYGDNAHDRFKHQSIDVIVNQLYDFIKTVNKLHLAGYAHGDLKIDNFIFVNNEIKLCDWYSLSDFTRIVVEKYRYIGDNLPPEAMRAFYFGENTGLTYSLVIDHDQERSYLLHPVASDRFCLAISLLEVLAPDLYKNYTSMVPKNFNPYKPDSLEFWPKYVAYINATQKALLQRAAETENVKKRELFQQLSTFIELDPMKREMVLSDTLEHISRE